VKAIIPVAGIGTRLRPHTHTTPKVLIKVAGKTIIEYIVDEIIKYERIDEIIFIIGYLGEQIKTFIKDKYKNRIKLSFVNQHKREGLAHAIYLAEKHINKEPILIILGDTLFKADFANIINSDKNYIGVKKVNDPRRFGIVFTDSKNRINKFIEKPETSKSKLAIVGIYRIKDSEKLFQKIEYIIKNDIKTKGEYQLTDALQLMLKENIEMETFEIEKWLDCGKPETLLSTNREILRQYEYKNNIKESDVIIIPPVFIPATSKIKNSIIGPNVSVGENVTIKNSIIKNSIVNDEAYIENLLLSDSLIGRSTTIKGLYRHLNIGDSSEVDFG